MPGRAAEHDLAVDRKRLYLGREAGRRLRAPIGHRESTPQKRHRLSARTTGTVAAKDKKKTVIIAAAVIVVAAIGAGALFFGGRRSPQGDQPGPASTHQPPLSPEEREIRDARARAAGNVDALFETVIPILEKHGRHEEVEQELLTILQARPEHPQATAKVLEMYFTRRKAIAAGDIAGKIALAKWCEKMRLMNEKRRELLEILLLYDAANEDARRMLGFVKVGTQWEDATYSTKLKAIEEQRARLRAKTETLTKRQKTVRDVVTIFQGRFGRDKFEYLDAPPYLLFAEKSPSRSAKIALEEYVEVTRHLFDLLMGTYDKLCDLKGLEEEVMPVYIFEDRARYVQLTGAPFYAGGHFEPHTGYVFIPYDFDTRYQVIFHECTHQFVQFATQFKGKKQSNQWWFTEGIATYFETFRRKPDGGFELGIIGDDNRYFDGPSGAKKIVRAGTYEKFERFFNMDYAAALRRALKKGGDYMMRIYSQSWSLVYFFYHYDNGKYRSSFEEYTRREINGQGGFEAAKEVFGDIEALEKEWKEFITELRP